MSRPPAPGCFDTRSPLVARVGNGAASVCFGIPELDIIYRILYFTCMAVEVSATELARNIGDVLARVRYRGQTFLVRKNGKVIARIVPTSDREGAPAKDAFAAWAAAAPSDPGFADDLERVGRADRPGANPWDS